MTLTQTENHIKYSNIFPGWRFLEPFQYITQENWAEIVDLQEW